VYKTEFLKNANLTLYSNILGKKKFLKIPRPKFREMMYIPYGKAAFDVYPFKGNKLLSGVLRASRLFKNHRLDNDRYFNEVKIISRYLKREDNPCLHKFNTDHLYTNLNDILTLNLKISEENSLNSHKNIFFKKDLLFVCNLSQDMALDQHIFKESKLNHPKKEQGRVPRITEFSDLGLINSFDSLSSSAFNNFFEHEVLNNYNCVDLIQHPDLDDETRLVKRSSGKSTPIRVLKCPNTELFFKDSLSKNLNIEILRFRFNEQSATIVDKPIKPTVYLTFKQKRYNQKNSINQKTQMFLSKDYNNIQKYSGNPFLKEASIIEENFGNPTRQYKLVKKAKSRLDTTRVANWNRLLRSRRVLVLPAHINITVITNSFDVVHSWHIPGLGLKMDCLPGRATHHTMYIDNVGLYYGQCAEVCGRYHHHMPIRVCALPFEHFLVW
jgi:hypothetical protein